MTRTILDDHFWLAAGATALFCLLAPEVPAAESYISLEAGLQRSLATHNDDELETGSEGEWMVGAAVGARTSLSARVAARVEVEATYRQHELHGLNGPNACSCDVDSLPHNTMRAWSLMANAWPEFGGDRWAVYAGGGLGAAYVTALRDEALTPAGQAGAGLLIHFAAVEIDLGYRYWTTGRLQLDGQKGRYETHGPAVRVSWGFGR